MEISSLAKAAAVRPFTYHCIAIFRKKDFLLNHAFSIMSI